MSRFARPFLILSCSISTVFATPSDSPDTDDRLRKLEKAVAALQKENAELKQELKQTSPAASETAVASAINKVKLSDSVTELRLYGEGRLRYFFNDGEAAGLDHGDHGDRDRLRYRLRLGADVKVQDDWMLGVLVETNNSARSANVTLGENPVFAKGTVSKSDVLASLTTSAGATVTGIDPATGRTITGTTLKGVTTKTGSVVGNVNFGDALFLGRIFLKYDPEPWLTLTGGKIANPFVTSRMVWDPDLNPEGFAEQFHFSFGPSPSRDPKDGASHGISIDLFSNLGQFIYDDVGFENSFNSGTGQPFSQAPQLNDRWMFGWQVGTRINFTPDIHLQVAPAFFHYTGSGTSSSGPFNGDSPLVVLNKHAEPELITFNQTGTNDLAFLEVPVELAWKWHDLPMSVFGDVAYNFDADQRATAAGHPDKHEGLAYQLGASVGKTGHKGDWELRGWWQHSEAYAVDQNIVDDDIFDGRLNMEGFYLQGTYNITDAVSFILQYSHAERIDNTLGTPGFGALGTAPGFPLQRTNLFYVDLNLKF